MKKIYTRSGDKGETGLLFGGRVPKNDLRLVACGLVDEANSALGLARAMTKEHSLQKVILEIQRTLFVVGAELATTSKFRTQLEDTFEVVDADMTKWAETTMDRLAEQIDLPGAFIIPGATVSGAAIDLARATLRRAEREVVTLNQENLLDNAELLRYMNRVSDLLFILARYQERCLPPEILTGVRK